MSKSRPGRRRRLWIAALAALAALAAAELESQTPTTTIGERVDVTVATAVVRLPGAPAGARELPPSTVEIREDGVARRVLSISRWLEPTAPGATGSAAVEGRPPRAEEGPLAGIQSQDGASPEILLYLDLPMTGIALLREIVRGIGPSLAELARAGAVTVVVANPEPAVRLDAARDPGAVVALLESLVSEVPSRGIVEAHRRALLDESEWNGGVPVSLLAQAALEAQQIANARARLVRWLAGRAGSASPRLLFLVGGSFDSDPTEFYLRFGGRDRERAAEGAGLARDLQRLSQHPAEAALAEALAAWGWRVYPISPADVGWSDFGSARESGASRWRAHFGGEPSARAPFLFVDPGDGWQVFAERSGGQLVRTPRTFAEARRGLEESFLVAYERPGVPTGRTFALDVRSAGDGQLLEAPRVASEGTPDDINVVRAAQADPEFGARGGLEVELRLLSSGAERKGERRVRLAVGCRSAVPGIEPTGRLRIAVAIGAHGESAKSSAESRGCREPITIDLRVPADTEELGVAVEDGATGLWGAARLRLPSDGA